MNRVRIILVCLALAGCGFAQAPPVCPLTQSTDDAIACGIANFIWANNKFYGDAQARFAVLDKKITDTQVMTSVINTNQTSEQTQIESLKTTVQQLLTDSAAMQAQLAMLPNLSKGPLISAPGSPVFSAGAVTLSWTNYVPGQAVFTYCFVAGCTNASGAIYPAGNGPGYTVTVTKPSGTTIYYWLKVNEVPNGNGYTFTSAKYTVTIP